MALEGHRRAGRAGRGRHARARHRWRHGGRLRAHDCGHVRSRRLRQVRVLQRQRRPAARTPGVGQGGRDAGHPDGLRDRRARRLQRRTRREPDAERRRHRRGVAHQRAALPRVPRVRLRVGRRSWHFGDDHLLRGGPVEVLDAPRAQPGRGTRGHAPRHRLRGVEGRHQRGGRGKRRH